MTSWGGDIEVAVVDGHRCLRYRNRHRCVTGFLTDARRYGTRVHLVAGQRRITFDQHERAIDETARLMLEAGIGRGDRVLLLGANRPEWLVAFWAVLRVGGVVVPGNAWWDRAEIEHAVRTVTPALAVVDGPRRGMLPRDLATLDLDDLQRVVDDPAGSDPLPTVAVDEDDPALILFTAGTTGPAKGATLAHRALIANQQNLLTFARRYPPDIPLDAPPAVSLLTVPLFHIAGVQTVLATLLTGGTLIFLEGRFDAGEVLRLIEQERVTRWGCVPTMVSRVIDHPDLAIRDTSSLRSLTMGGSPVSPALVTRAREAFPAARRGVGSAYGLSESCGVLTTGQGDGHAGRPSSVGKPMPVVEIRIEQPDPDGIGEILARSPTLMSGYWGTPDDETVDAAGWLHTGDIGRVDADGNLYVLDRRKDVIIRGGENITGPHVEESLRSHPDVLDVAVVGLPHEDLGEEVGAVVVVRPDSEVSAAALAAYAGARLGRFEVPTAWWFRSESLPTSPAGKVLKRELKRAWPHPEIVSGLAAGPPGRHCES